MQVTYKTYEFEIKETRTYYVQGSGTSRFAAEQDAIARFHRLGKEGELVAHAVSKPTVTKTIK